MQNDQTLSEFLYKVNNTNFLQNFRKKELAIRYIFYAIFIMTGVLYSYITYQSIFRYDDMQRIMQLATIIYYQIFRSFIFLISFIVEQFLMWKNYRYEFKQSFKSNLLFFGFESVYWVVIFFNFTYKDNPVFGRLFYF